MVTRKSHKLQIGGSIPSPATNFKKANMQQYKKLSRGPQVDTEACVANAGGNRFDLVLIAAVRAREISRKHRAAELGTQINAPVGALLDIQNGLVGVEYLKKVQESGPAKRVERFY